MKTATRKPTISRAKITLTATPNGINWDVRDTNPARRCTASILNVASKGWTVRIDKGGKAWKYLASIPVATPEAAYEYALEFGGPVAE